MELEHILPLYLPIYYSFLSFFTVVFLACRQKTMTISVPDLQVRADGVTALHLAAEAGFVGEPNTETWRIQRWERIKG